MEELHHHSLVSNSQGPKRNVLECPENSLAFVMNSVTIVCSNYKGMLKSLKTKTGAHVKYMHVMNFKVQKHKRYKTSVIAHFIVVPQCFLVQLQNFDPFKNK